MVIEDPGDLSAYLPGSGGQAWLRRGEGMIGLGEFARLEGADPIQADLWWQDLCAGLEHQSELSGVAGVGPIAFASFVFDPDHTEQRSVLVVPEVVIGRRNRKCWLTRIGPGELPVEPMSSGAGGTDSIELTGQSLDAPAWQAIVEEAVARISDGLLDKVVLARAVTLTATKPLDAQRLVSRLSHQYPSCWTYHIDSLVGASPEMLIRRERGLATSRVLAGTIRRNGGEELDLKLAQALARSSKNLIEHELAVESVARALEPFCSGMNVPDAPYVLELPNVLHLASDVTAVAHPEVSALRLAGELHPSAAVCGTPTEAARKTIAELEQLDRGRYSGPVGWLDTAGDGEFAIALRCGLISVDEPNQITIYAGCGIVAESDPVEEYAETEAKLLPMLSAINSGGRLGP